jgi:hypothetical protein
MNITSNKEPIVKIFIKRPCAASLRVKADLKKYKDPFAFGRRNQIYLLFTENKSLYTCQS